MGMPISFSNRGRYTTNYRIQKQYIGNFIKIIYSLSKNPLNIFLGHPLYKIYLLLRVTVCHL